jgi:Holliday junction resolvase
MGGGAAMTHPSKNKGNCFERELVNQAIESGLSSKRAYASNGESLGHHAEVDLLVAGQRIQAKRRKALPAYLCPTDNVDAVVFRADRCDTLVLLNWFDYLDLLKKVETKDADIKG